MKKALVLMISFILVACITAGIFFFGDKLIEKDSVDFSYVESVEVAAGKAVPASTNTAFTVEEDGVHTISLGWLPAGKTIEEAMKMDPSELCFVTGCVIRSDNDPCVYATTGGWLTLDTDIELEAGDYRIDYYYLTDKESYLDFAGRYFGSVNGNTMADEIHWDQMKKDASVTVSYHCGVSSAENFTAVRLILLVVTFLLILLIALLAFFAATGGKLEKFRFDERQEALRGKGFRLSFYVMLGYLLWIFLVDTMGFVRPEFYAVLYTLGLLIGVLVYAVYAIWNDCYFALNERKSTSIGILAALGLLNLMIGVSGVKRLFSASHSPIFGAGVSKTPLINLAVAVMLIVIAFTLFLKKLGTDKAADEEEEA